MEHSEEFADFSEVFEVSRMVNQAILKKIGKNPLKKDIAIIIKNQSEIDAVIGKAFDDLIETVDPEIPFSFAEGHS